MTLRLLLLPGLVLAAALPAAGEDIREDARNLDRVIVVAQRQPEPLAQVASSVTLVDREQIDTRLAVDAADLLRYLPGLRMDSEANRFGAQGINIRGLGGNRVRVEIDGVPLPDAFAVGQFAAAGRDLGDLAPIERIEVLRGPASTLYGSDALAGIVAVRTLDPADLVADGEQLQQLRLRHDSRDDGNLLSILHAQSSHSGRSILLQAFQREGGTLDNRGREAAEAPNPADSERRGMLARFGLPLADQRSLRLVAEHQEGRRDTDVVSQRFAPGRFASTYRLLADDRDQRSRLSAEAELGAAAGFDSIDLLAYLQDGRVDQRTDQFRLPDRATRFESLRERRFVFEQADRGLDLLARRGFDRGAARHDLLAGIEWQRTRYRGLRGGLETNLETGAQSNVILGETMPVRDFPTSVAERRALFVQDEIRIGRLSLIPGLRFEQYRLDARPDAIFSEDYPDLQTVDGSEDSLTGKFGLRWAASPSQQVYLQYARGFRAPPFGDLNIGLSLALLNFEVRPNPNLRPETSHGLELGWRYSGASLQASMAVYQNRFSDLIDSRANLGIDPDSGALVFQSVNRDRARIEGVELELEWELETVSARLEGWRLHAALAASRGQDTRREVPLDSIDPHRAVLGLRHFAASGRWGGELLLTATARKDRLDRSAGEPFAPPGHALLDSFAWYAPSERLRFTFGLRNLADRRIWNWSSVRGLPANTPNLGFYSAPGRSLSLGMTLQW